MFFVEKGRMKITIYREDAGSTIEDTTILSSGGMTHVEPSLYHFLKGWRIA